MKIKRYFADDMRRAIQMVRQEQGPDAVILEAKGPAGGPESDGEVSVLAAVDRHPEMRPASGLVEEAQTQMGPDKARPTGHQNNLPFHH